MRKFLLPFLFVALSIPACAQQFAIPYRDGSRWGISDRDGTLLIAPKFDSLSFSKYGELADRSMLSTIGNSHGLVVGGREILPAEYSRIIAPGDFIRADKLTSQGSLTYIFDKDGLPVFPEGVLHISMMVQEQVRDKTGNYKVMVLHVTAANGLESIFVWSDREKAVVQWLVKDVYSAAIEYVKGNGYRLLRVREKEASPVVLSRYWFEDGRFSPVTDRRSIPVDKQRDEEPRISDYYGEGDLMISSPSGDLEKGTDAVPEPDMYSYGSGSGNGNSVGEGTGPRKNPVAQKPPVNAYINYKKNTDGSLVLEQRDGNGSLVKSNMKYTPESFTIKALNTTKRKGDTLYYYTNYVIYTYKGRTGVLKDGQKSRGKEYDMLTDIRYFNEKDRSQVLGFIAGNRDKAKVIKYGIIDANGGIILPFDYELITPVTTGSIAGYDFIVKKNGKYGVITAGGTVHVPIEMDEIKNITRDSPNYLDLKAGTGYGFFMRLGYDRVKYMKPVLPYPIKKIEMYYPASVNGQTAENNRMVLLELADANGNIKGYAGEDGFLYFKE